MKSFKHSSGNIMVKAGSFNWLQESVYANDIGKPYFYRIYVGHFSGGHSCVYIDEKKVLSITNIAYSSEDPPLKFKVDDIKMATTIVESFANGMGVDLTGKIYKDKP